MTELSQAAKLDLAKEPYCTCCDVRVSCCGKKKEKEQLNEIRAYRKKLAKIGWFRAAYPGICARCGTHFDAQTMIKDDRFGHRRYIGECCAPF